MNNGQASGLAVLRNVRLHQLIRTLYEAFVVDGTVHPCFSCTSCEYLRTAPRKGSADGGAGTFPARISSNGMNFPYNNAVSSLSWLITAPFRSMPAKMPRARE